MRVKVSLSIGFPSATRKETLDLPDELTDEEIDEEVQQWAMEFMDFGWVKVV